MKTFFFDPLEQFEIYEFCGFSKIASLITNLSIFMSLNAVFLATILHLVYNRGLFNV